MRLSIRGLVCVLAAVAAPSCSLQGWEKVNRSDSEAGSDSGGGRSTASTKGGQANTTGGTANESQPVGAGGTTARSDRSTPAQGGASYEATLSAILGGSTGSEQTTSVGGQTAVTTSTPTPAFRGGPCVVTTNSGAAIEVFARGTSHIYRRAVDGSTETVWEPLVDLDASQLDNRSDLDCSYAQSTVHIVAMGNAPAGAVLRATGSGTSYNPFRREIGAPIGGFYNTTFDSSPSIYTGAFPPALAVQSGNTYLFGEFKEGGFELINGPANPAVSSAVDLAEGGSGYGYAIVASFEQTGNMMVRFRSFATTDWIETVLTPPSGTQYEYSPTTCTGVYTGTSLTYYAAVAGGKLWFSRGGTSPIPWVLVSDNVASAPDCSISGTENPGQRDVNVVALNKQGGVTLHKGFEGGDRWEHFDLGSYSK